MTGKKPGVVPKFLIRPSLNYLKRGSPFCAFQLYLQHYNSLICDDISTLSFTAHAPFLFVICK